MPEPETSREAFVRGQASGKVDARLQDHDDHFRRLNGSLEDLSGGIHELILVVQRLSDKFDASEVTKVTTASALEKAEVARRDRDDSSWSPLARWAAAISIVGGLIALVVVFLR